MTDATAAERDSKSRELETAAQSAPAAPETAPAAERAAGPAPAEASSEGASAPAQEARSGLGRISVLAGAAQRLRPSARSRRLAAQAAAVALIAGSGAMLGSFGYAAIERALGNAADVRAEATEEVRGLKNELAQLRAQMKTANDQVASLRTGLTNAGAASNAQFAKVSEALERIDKRAVQASAPEITGSLVRPQAAAPLKPVPGWTVRRVFNGIALIEGRGMIMEIEPGDHLPELGRVQDIKREGGRWVVVTSRGLVTSR